jgi:hypothetical protein
MVVFPTGRGTAWRPVWESGFRGEELELTRKFELEGRDQDGTRR